MLLPLVATFGIFHIPVLRTHNVRTTGRGRGFYGLVPPQIIYYKIIFLEYLCRMVLSLLHIKGHTSCTNHLPASHHLDSRRARWTGDFLKVSWLFAKTMDWLIRSIHSCSSIAVDAANTATYLPGWRVNAGTQSTSQASRHTLFGWMKRVRGSHKKAKAATIVGSVTFGVENAKRVRTARGPVLRRVHHRAVGQVDSAFQLVGTGTKNIHHIHNC